MQPPMSPPRSIVLLPGLDGTGMLFQPLVERLQGTYQSLVHPYSPSEVEDLDTLATQAAAAINAHAHPTVVAESFSSLVLLTMLAAGLIQPASIVLVCGFTSCPRPLLGSLARPFPFEKVPRSLFWGAAATRTLLGTTKGREVELFRQAIASVRPEVLAHRIKTVISSQIELDPVQTPTLYLQARDDWIVPHSALNGVQQTFASLSTVQIPGPHLLAQTRPQEVADAIKSFLD